MNERNDDWLDRVLRDDARHLFEDAGFTNGVMSALPTPAYPWLKTALIVGSTALGGLLAALLAPIGPLVLEGITEIAHLRGITPAVSVTLAMTVVLAVSGYVLATED